MTTANARRPPTLLTRCAVGVARILLFLLLLDIVLFLMFDVLPSAEIGQLGVFAIDPALLETSRDRLGTSGPWYERLVEHWSALCHGSLGQSLVGDYSIGEVVRRRIVRSLPLWIGTLALLPLAILAAMPYATRRQTLVHEVARWLGQFAGIPQFLAAAIFFSLWIVLTGIVPLGLMPSAKWVFAIGSCAALPFGVLFVAAANTFRQLAAEEFCTTYLSLGMDWPAIRRRLLLNAVIALRPLFARLVLWTLTGSILAEAVFGITGFGHLLVEAMRTGDINVARIWMLFAGGAVIAVTELERR
jgi:ABC-type dipeptide/oligopeptide/nickel transport system permease component